VSQTGDWFNVVALFSLLLELTGKGEAVALALLTRFVPMFFAGPAAGVLADRVSRRAILVVSDLLRSRSCSACCSSADPIRCGSRTRWSRPIRS